MAARRRGLPPCTSSTRRIRCGRGGACERHRAGGGDAASSARFRSPHRPRLAPPTMVTGHAAEVITDVARRNAPIHRHRARHVRDLKLRVDDRRCAPPGRVSVLVVPILTPPREALGRGNRSRPRGHGLLDGLGSGSGAATARRIAHTSSRCGTSFRHFVPERCPGSCRRANHRPEELAVVASLALQTRRAASPRGR
jgi:hypothetical protein